ncbi:ester cyclase [Halogeometricum borinquense]|uniref:Ester cyclase n=1 Tax=Halogeometricum borinquense TaxID=60847 RepID=A0A6C0UCM9_9EURY|nr:ester cyclase [Halogeometricum borinquense]QIB72847.1 ester cyclase [Halogeometricum borinquense]QIQ75197.1 ester cyclase [Halogeometricum borinquense]
MTTDSLTPQERENERIARRIPEDVFGDGGLDVLDDLYAPNAVDHNPFGSQEGLEAIRESYESFLSAFPDITQTVERSVVHGDVVTLHITSRGTHSGVLWGIEPTAKEIEVQQMAFVRIEDGLIAERWFLSDNLTLLRQLGVVDFP